MKIKGFKFREKINNKLLKKASIFTSLTFVMCLGFILFSIVSCKNEIKKLEASTNNLIYTSPDGVKYYEASIITDRFGNRAEYDISAANDGSIYACVVQTKPMYSNSGIATRDVLDFDYETNFPNASSMFGTFIPEPEYFLLINGTGSNNINFTLTKVPNTNTYVEISNITYKELNCTIDDLSNSNFKNVAFTYEEGGSSTGSVVPWLYSLTDEQISKITTCIIPKDRTGLKGKFLLSGLPNLKEVRFETDGSQNKIFNGMSGMFMYSGIKSIDLSMITNSYSTNASYMFAYCENLVDIDISKLTVSPFTSVFALNGMFEGCSKIKKLDFSSWPAQGSGNYEYTNMFNGLTSLEYLNVSNFDMDGYEQYAAISNSTKLKTVILPKTYATTYYGPVYLPKENDTDAWYVYSADGTQISVANPVGGAETYTVDRLIAKGTPSITPAGKTASYVVRSTEVDVSLNDLKLGDVVAFGKPNRTNAAVVPEDEKYKWRVVAFNDLDGDPLTGIDGKEAPLFMLDDWYYDISSGNKVVKKMLFDSRVNNAYDPSDFVNTHLDDRSDANGEYDKGDYSPNRYATSDMRLFLNSNKGNTVIGSFPDGHTERTNTNVSDTKGFLSRFGEEEKYLRTVPIKTLQGQAQIAQRCYDGGTEEYNSHKNTNSSFCLSIGWLFGSRKMATIYDDEACLDDDEMINYDKGYYEVTYDKVFLPSLKDMHDIYQNSIREANNNGWRADKYKENSLKYSGNDDQNWDDSHIRSFWLRDAGSLTTVGTFIYNMAGENIIPSSKIQPGNMYKSHDRNYYSVKMKEAVKSTLDGYPELDADPQMKDDSSYRVTDSSNSNVVKRCQTGIVPCCYLKEGTLFTYSGTEGAYVISGGTIDESKEYAKVVTLETEWNKIKRPDEIRGYMHIENPDHATFVECGFEIYDDSGFTNKIATKKSTTEATNQSIQYWTTGANKLSPNKTYYIKTYVTSEVDGVQKTMYGTPYKITTGRPVIINCYGNQGSEVNDGEITFKYRVLSLMGANPESIYIKGAVMGYQPSVQPDTNYHGNGSKTSFADYYHYAKWDDIKQFLAYTVYQDGYVSSFSKKIDKDSLVVSTAENGYQLNEVTVTDRFPANGRVLSQIFTVYEPKLNEKAVATDGYKASINLIPYGNYSTTRTNRHYNVTREGGMHFYNWAAAASPNVVTGKQPITNNQIYFTEKFDDNHLSLRKTANYTAPNNFANNSGSGTSYSVLQNDLVMHTISSKKTFTGQYGVDTDSLAWYEYQTIGTTESTPTEDTTSKTNKKYALKAKVKEKELAPGEGFYFPEIPEDYFETAGYDYGQIIKNEAFTPAGGNTDINGEEIEITMYFPRLKSVYTDENSKEYHPDNEAIIEKDKYGRLCKWDISKNQDESVMAVVFKKQKNKSPIKAFVKKWFWSEGTEGNYETEDYDRILVIYQGNLKEGNGAGEKVEFQYYSAIGQSGGSHHILDFTGDEADRTVGDANNTVSLDEWRYASDNAANKFGNIVPWTLYLDARRIKKVVLVDVDFSDYSGLFAGIPSITNEDLDEIIIGEYETSDNQMTRNVTNVKGMFAGSTNLENIDLSMLGMASVNIPSDEQTMFNGCSALKKIVLPKSVPSNSDYDITLPNGSSFLARDSEGEIVDTVGTNGTVSKLITRGTDDADYIEIDENVWFLDRLNAATNDADIKNLLWEIAPGTTDLVINYFDKNKIVCKEYNDSRSPYNFLAINYTWEKLKEKRAKQPPEGYTTPDEFFNELKKGLDLTKYEVLTKDSYQVDFGGDLDFVIGGVGASNTKDLYIKFSNDVDYTNCNFGNNTLTNVTNDGYLYLYKTLKDSQLLTNEKIKLGRAEVHINLDDSFILRLINNASDEVFMVMLFTEQTDYIDYINEKFDTGYYPDEDDPDYKPGFVDILVSTLLYTEKEKTPYTSIEDVANDIKSAFEAKPVLKINNQSSKGSTVKGGDANFEISISNNDSRILDLLEVVDYEKIELTPHDVITIPAQDIGAPPEISNFIKIDSLCDDNYDVYANERTVYDFWEDNEYKYESYFIVWMETEDEIYKNGTVINANDEKDILTLYYYFSCNPDYQYTHDTSRINNGIAEATALWQDMSYHGGYITPDGTKHITSQDDITNPIKLQRTTSGLFGLQVGVMFSPYWGTYENLDGTNLDSAPIGDSRLYIKIPKTYETLESVVLQGFSTMSETLSNVDEDDEGIYRATVHIKDSPIETLDDMTFPMSTNSVELGLINVTLDDSDVTFQENTTFTYDGNAHYIEEIINPDKAGFTYTAEYHKGSATGELINKDDIKDAGTYYLVITVDPSTVGPGSVTSWSKEFSITKKSMNSIIIDDSSVLSAEYTGSDIDPSSGFVIKDGDNTLDPSSYKITYEDSQGNTVTYPKEVGEYTVIISDKSGNYFGTKEFKFNVVPTQITITDDMFDENPNLILEKVYDGLDSYTFDETVNVEGVDVQIKVSVKFDDKNVGDEKQVTITVSFKNTSDQSKYGFSKTQITGKTGKITPKNVTWNASVNDKAYDGTTNITPSDITINTNDFIQGDNVSISKSGSYANKKVGNNKHIDLTLSLNGADKDNYTITSGSIETGKITTRKLDYTVQVGNKAFDNSKDIKAKTTVNITDGIQGSDDVSINVVSANFKNADKGQNKDVDVVLELAGDDRDNYYINQPTGLKANITSTIVKLEFNTPISKEYDGTKDGAGLVTIKKITKEDGTVLDIPVKLSSITFDDKNAGQDKKVYIVPEFENEGDKENYSFEMTKYTLTNGEITKKQLEFNISVTSKTYDGERTATGVAVKNSFQGLVSGDNPNITLTNGQFASKDAGDNITVTFDASIDDSNYQISSRVSGNGTIKKKDIHIDATTDDGEYDEGDIIDVHFALRTSDLVTGESVGISQNSGTGVVQADGTKKVKKVTIDTWPNLTGSNSVLKNYNEVHSECVVNLTRINLDNERLEITITTRKNYDGSPVEVNVLIRYPELGITLHEGTDFTFDYLDDHTDIGTHQIKIEFIGEYKGSKIVDFEIEEKKTPTPPSGGGGGGGGGGSVAPSGPTYTIIPEVDLKAIHKSYMNGYEDMTFKPQNAISREEVATIVARLHDEFNEDYNFTSFNDFEDASDRWSKNYIGFCKMKDLVHGYEDGSFHPTSLMTRAELATLVNNFLRVQNANFEDVDLNKPAFSDVDGKWYEESVNKLAHLGILNGYEDGTFKGDNPVSRIEVAIVMNKVNHRAVTKDIPDEYIEKVTSMFSDVAKDRWFFKDVAEAAVDHPNDLY